MANDASSIVIKKYANRRLYNTASSSYVTLDDLAAMVRRGDEFVVQDAKTGEDITRGVLGQIIFDAESRGGGLLPIAFLRQLITFYGGHMQTLVPAYLEHALSSFAREQERFSRQVNQEIGKQALTAVEDQVRRNMDMFERSMRMFMPYGGEPPADADREKEDPLARDVADLKTELMSMQAKLDALARPQNGAEATQSTDHPVASTNTTPPQGVEPAEGKINSEGKAAD